LSAVSAGQGDPVDGADPVDDAFVDRGELPDLLVGDHVDEELAHLLDVHRCHSADRFRPRLGEADDGPATILRAGALGNQTATFHASDLVGHATAIPPQPRAQLARPPAHAPGLTETDQPRVIRQRPPRVALELPLDRPFQQLVDVPVPTPHALLVLVQPAGLVHADIRPRGLLRDVLRSRGRITPPRRRRAASYGSGRRRSRRTAPGHT